MEFQISNEINEADRQQLIAGLEAYSAGIIPPMIKTPLAIYCRQGEQLLAGLTGESYWGWLYIRLLWVHPSQRGTGLGQKLVTLAEKEGIKRDCRYVYVNTFSYQAPEFYQKLGYQVWGQLDDFPAGHRRIYLFKPLPQTLGRAAE